MDTIRKGTETDLELIEKIVNELNKGNFNINLDQHASLNPIDPVLSGISIIQQELQKSKISSSILENLLDTIPEFVICTDHNLNVVRSNSNYNNFIHKVNSKNGNITDLLPKFDIKKILDSLQRNEVIKDFNSTFGTALITIPVQITVVTINRNSNSNENLLIVIKNQSEARRAELELQLKNDELESFIYSASHHLKGPLATILGLTNIVNEDTPIEEYKEYFNHIKIITKKLNDTLVDLVEFPKIGNFNLDLEEININELIENIIEQSQNEQGFTTVPYLLETNFQSSGKIVSVKVSIISILQHLIENAFKFQKHLTDGSALIKIDVRNVNDGIQISVTDNGPGIKEEYQKRIFELFKTASPKNYGTGLGLYIVKRQLDRIRGNIKLQSVHNNGTTAVIWIPNLKDGNNINL